MMNLTNQSQVSEFLAWAAVEHGIETASECEKVIQEWRAENRTSIAYRLDVVEIARSRTHPQKIRQAVDVANAKTDSRM